MFLVIIDGARYSETFGDSAHNYANIPHLWNDLRPLGTLYSGYHNTEMTNTTPAFHTMFTGAYVDGWNRLNNGAQGNLNSILPMYPTIFEYYRKEKGIPGENVRLISGNGALRTAMNSNFPGYGAAFGAQRSFYKNVSDDSVWAEIQRVMDTDHPSLVVVDLSDTDRAGHTAIWENYTAAIEHADSIIWELYKKIQAIPPYSDTFYRDKTALIVTTDHGRDQNAFYRHDRSDEGCRHVFFLVTGPEIRAGVDVPDFHDWVDVCPTIGELLGFATPYAQGRVLSEMLVGPKPRADEPRSSGHAKSPGPFGTDENGTKVTSSPTIAEDPSLAHSTSGLHLVWCDTRDGLSHLWYKRSTDEGGTWSPDTMLIDSFALFPKIVAREDTLLLCWAEYRTRINSEADWELYSMRSGDGGLTWSDKQRLSPPLFGGLFPAPILTAQGGANVLMTVLPPYPLPLGRMQMACRTSFDGGRTWPDSVQISSSRSLQPECPSIAADTNGVLYGAWRSMQYRNWEIVFSRSTDGGHTWLGETRLTDELHESYDPAIAVAGSSLDVVWSDFRSSTWQIYSKRSSDGGIHWTPDSAVTSSTVGAILPTLVSSGDTLHLFWVDFQDGNAELYYRSSGDGEETGVRRLV